MRKDLSAAWKIRHRRWLKFVQANIKAMESGKGIALGPSSKPLIAPAVRPLNLPPLKVLICAPHPDDEALIGALPLRLRNECGAQVVNVAITLGSNPRERPRRLEEVISSCQALGFDMVLPIPPNGFDNVNLDNRRDHPDEWAAKVRELCGIFGGEKPDVVFAPHTEDFNSTHIGTHHLVIEALGDYQQRTGCAPITFIETEFWHENSRPNLMAGVLARDEATLIMAAAEHGGEVRRNPYHLRHPGRLIENVRLGAEVVGGQGGAAPDFPFAELYRVAFMVDGRLCEPRPGGRVISPREQISWPNLLGSFRPLGMK